MTTPSRSAMRRAATRGLGRTDSLALADSLSRAVTGGSSAGRYGAARRCRCQGGGLRPHRRDRQRHARGRGQSRARRRRGRSHPADRRHAGAGGCEGAPARTRPGRHAGARRCQLEGQGGRQGTHRQRLARRCDGACEDDPQEHRRHARAGGRRALREGCPYRDALACDSFSRTAVYQRAVADPLSLSDAAETSGAGTLSLTDSVSLADAFTRVTQTQRSVADSVSLADATSRAFQRSIADALVLSDQLARAAATVRALADSLALTDQATPSLTTGAQAYEVKVEDTLALADLLRPPLRIPADADRAAHAHRSARAYHRPSRTFADALSLSDLVDPEVPGEEVLEDIVLLSDELFFVLFLGREHGRPHRVRP